MSQSVDLYGAAYGNFAAQALEQVRRETYGEDFGQSSWVTGEEYRRFFRRLELRAPDHVLDIGFQVTGVDVNEAGEGAVLATINLRLMGRIRLTRTAS
jgi:hypothetical protein